VAEFVRGHILDAGRPATDANPAPAGEIR